jgi:RNA polymerase sigma-70 factor (ECF subfamily)
MDRTQHEALEARIVARIQEGALSSAATEALRGYGPQVLGYLVTLLRDHALAEDAFSIFAEELWKSVRGFAGHSTFRTWAYTLAFRAAHRVRADGYRRRHRPFRSAELSAVADEVRQSTAVHLRTETKAGVAKLRASLSPEDQVLLFLRVEQGLSWKEVAQVMSEPEASGPVTEASLRKRFERLKVTLRELAEREGLMKR